MIVGRVGERVDVLLRDFEPFADGDFLADPIAETSYVRNVNKLKPRKG